MSSLNYVCERCQKIYKRKYYYDNHIKGNKCINKIDNFKMNEIDTINIPQIKSLDKINNNKNANILNHIKSYHLLVYYHTKNITL